MPVCRQAGTKGQRQQRQGTKAQRDKGTEGQRHKGTEAQRQQKQGTKATKARHKGTEGQRDRGTEGEGLSGTIIEDALGTPVMMRLVSMIHRVSRILLGLCARSKRVEERLRNKGKDKGRRWDNGRKRVDNRTHMRTYIYCTGIYYANNVKRQ